MNKKVLAIVSMGVILLVIVGIGIYVRSYLGLDKSSPFINNAPVVLQEIGDKTDISPVEYEIESVAEGLFVPWSIVFTAPNRIVITERNGKIRVIEDGKLVAQPLLTFPEVSATSEEGLMGLEIDPQYAQNKYLYTTLAYRKGDGLAVKVIRLVDEGRTVKQDKILLDDIPAAQNHAGSRVKFGPDSKLYVTTGDATEKKIAQDVTNLGGKILRMNSDGSIPSDNPFPNSYVYSYGHRNPQGIAWHPVSHALFETEHGPSVFDGPAGGDEVNIIDAKANYGWPIVSHEKHKDGMIDPLLVFTPAVAPASAMFYTGDIFPQFKNNFFFGGLKGSGIYRVVLVSDNLRKVERYEKLPGIDKGRIRDIIQGPDGFIYFSTSNRDGRGKTQTGDDHIYRLVPKK